MLPFRILLLLTSFLSFSCTSWQKNKSGNAESIKGDWLILYPDHELENEKQQKIYAKAQDSIVGLLGLKTISFHDDGSFVQTDSILAPAGKWHYNPDNNNLFIRNGGTGLDFFQGSFTGIKKDTMKVVEYVTIDGEKIKLTWFFKRIKDRKRAALFAKEENWWRNNNAASEKEQLSKKVKAMLSYYSLYYEMVSKESAYFSQSRVFLPFAYYQHSMGLRPFNANSNFSRQFYTIPEAEQAHKMLASAINKIEERPFPSGKDFVIEYSAYLKELADAIAE